ncbi:hypothetical protein EON66_10660, partial [archaeon]
PLLQVGGVATTVDNTTQQWDWPNGWAPLQHMLIRGLEDAQTNESEALAYSLAARWVASCYVAYVNTGYMHEKYDVLGIGDTGAGGEYTPQVCRAPVRAGARARVCVGVYMARPQFARASPPPARHCRWGLGGQTAQP